MKKEKIIIDTDPGVDDTTALIFALNNKHIDIKLITTVSGNVGIKHATRNACHIIDLFGKDIPVVKGASKPLARPAIHASYLHGQQGMGGYTPPQDTIHKPLECDVADKMYQVIMDNPHEITIFVWGPQTNIAHLLTKHPDSKNYIKQIIFMGGCPYGIEGFPNHDSFNIKSDPEAFQVVLDTQIPLKMLPSHIGRYKVGLNEADVTQVAQHGIIGKFLAKTYQGYLEPDMLEQGLKIVATNDTSALFCHIYPKIFTVKKANLIVDTKKNIGRTYIDFCEYGAIEIVTDVDIPKFKKLFFDNIDKIQNSMINTDLLKIKD